MKLQTNVTMPVGLDTVNPSRRITLTLVSTSGRAPAVGAQINDAAPSTETVYSSQRTEDVATAKVSEQLYDYDQLVATNLSV